MKCFAAATLLKSVAKHTCSSSIALSVVCGETTREESNSSSLTGLQSEQQQQMKTACDAMMSSRSLCWLAFATKDGR